MNYGQHSQNGGKTSDDVLFHNSLTEGVGAKPENINPDSAESLHSDDQSISWEGNPQEIGNKIINFPNNASRVSNNQERLGVVEPTMPPELNNDIIESQLEYNLNVDDASGYTNFKIIGGKATAAVIKTVKELEKKIDNNDAEGYNNAIRNDHDGAAVTILEQSFGPNSAWERKKREQAEKPSNIINSSDYYTPEQNYKHKEAA